MEDKEFRRAYKELFDGIKAGDELRARVLAGKRKRYDARPAIAAIGTIAAAVAIFAAVRGYDFSHSDDGIIYETAVTETAAPQKTVSGTAEQNTEEPVAQAAENEERPVYTSEPAKKTTGDYAREALEGMSTSAPVKTDTQPAAKSRQSAQQSTRQNTVPAPEVAIASDRPLVPQETNGNMNETYEEYTASAKEQETPDVQQRVMKRSSGAGASVTEETVSEYDGGSLVLPFPTGPVTLGMNSQSVLTGFMYEAAPAAESEKNAEEYHTEEWDNKMYFDYLGFDVINDLDLSDDMRYTGDDSYYFAVDADGRLKNDTRIFIFEGSEGRFVSVLTSRDTTFVDSVLSSPEVMKSEISGVQVAAFRPDRAYYFYMKSNDAAYIITTEELDGNEIADLLFSINTEQ